MKILSQSVLLSIDAKIRIFETLLLGNKPNFLSSLFFHFDLPFPLKHSKCIKIRDLVELSFYKHVSSRTKSDVEDLLSYF